MPFVPPNIRPHDALLEGLAAPVASTRNNIGALLEIAFSENLGTPRDMQELLADLE